MKRSFTKYSALVLLVIFANFAGCGVKGNPVSSSNLTGNGQIVKNFSAEYNGGVVILNWDLYCKDSKVDYIVIERSEWGSTGNECKDCPRTFERISQIIVKEEKQESKEYKKYSFTDNKVINRTSYNYHLLICNNFNECRQSSAVEIILK